MKLTREDGFRDLVEIALKSASAEHLFVSFSDETGGTTRFANNQVTQNVDVRRRTFSATAMLGQQRGRASTSDLSADGIRDAVKRAETIAKASPPDPEAMPPLGKQQYQILPTMRAETAEATPERRIVDASKAIALCRLENVQAAGIVSAYTSATGLAANSGLFAFETRTRAEFSLTATAADSSGWVSAANRSIDDLDVERRTRIAVDKARKSAQPRELPAGRYTVILEPAAVAGIFGSVVGAMEAKSYHRGTSALAGKLNQQILDSRLTLRNRPDHGALLGGGFDAQGLSTDYHAWIDRGVLKRLSYDRFTAREHNTDPTFRPDAMHLSGSEPLGESVDTLIKTTDRGVLVTNFWYIRDVNRTDLTLTGMTRDGTFLVENGQIVGGLVNFRFHDSPLRAFNNIDAFTIPMEAISNETSKMLVPAMRIRDFNFSSVTRF